MPELERGFRMVKLGNWDAALDIFQRVTETYPNSPLVHKAYYNLGLSYMYTDQFDQRFRGDSFRLAGRTLRFYTVQY